MRSIEGVEIRHADCRLIALAVDRSRQASDGARSILEPRRLEIFEQSLAAAFAAVAAFAIAAESARGVEKIRAIDPNYSGL